MRLARVCVFGLLRGLPAAHVFPANERFIVRHIVACGTQMSATPRRGEKANRKRGAGVSLRNFVSGRGSLAVAPPHEIASVEIRAATRASWRLAARDVRSRNR